MESPLENTESEELIDLRLENQELKIKLQNNRIIVEKLKEENKDLKSQIDHLKKVCDTKDQPKDKPKEQLKDQPIDKPEDKSKDKIKDQSKDKPKDQPSEQPKDKSKGQPQGESREKSKNEVKKIDKEDINSPTITMTV